MAQPGDPDSRPRGEEVGPGVSASPDPGAPGGTGHGSTNHGSTNHAGPGHAGHRGYGASEPAGLGPDEYPPAADAPAAEAAPADERAASYRDVFSLSVYRHLFAANLLSQLGDQLTKVALAVLVYNRSGKPVLAAVAYAVSFVPWVVGGPLLSSYADLLPRRQVMIACDVARCGLVAILAIPGMPIPALIAVLFVANLLAPPFSSSRAAMMPDLLHGDAYVVANGVDNVVRQVAQVAGFLLGGASVLLLRPQGALVVDAATFAVSALLVLRGVPDLPPASEHTRRFSLLRDTGSGVRIVFGDPVLRAYVTLFWVGSAFTYAFEGIAVPWAMQLYPARGGSGVAGAAGVILASAPLGMAAGALVLTRALGPRRRMRLLVPFAVMSVAALIPTLVVDALPGVLLLLVIAGFGNSFVAPLNALFVRAVPAEYRGRAFGVAQSGVQAIQGLAMLAAGGAAMVFAPGIVVGWCGILGTVAVVGLSWALWPRDDFHRGR